MLRTLVGLLIWLFSSRKDSYEIGGWKCLKSHVKTDHESKKAEVQRKTFRYKIILKSVSFTQMNYLLYLLIKPNLVRHEKVRNRPCTSARSASLARAEHLAAAKGSENPGLKRRSLASLSPRLSCLLVSRTQRERGFRLMRPGQFISGFFYLSLSKGHIGHSGI